MSIEHLLSDLTDDDRAAYTRAINEIGGAFAALTGVTPSPETVAALPQIRDHVLAGQELDVSAGVAALKDVPELSNQLIAKQVKKAEECAILEATASMTPQQKMNYARERGLVAPRDDLAGSNRTMIEHHAILARLSLQQRMNYARKHGIA